MAEKLSEPVAERSVVVAGGYDIVPVGQIKRQVQAIQEVMKDVMKKDEHYGTIPGCGKKSVLFQSGAQKINLIFRFRPEIRIKETDNPGGHKTYDAVVDIIHIPTGDIVGQGAAVCSTMESKYRYRLQARTCPACGVEAIIKGKQEWGGGWVCVKTKGGCAKKYADKDKTITEQEIGRVEYEDPADYYNTCKKMAVKRAYVSGTLSATAASDIFTQDIDNDIILEAAAINAEMGGGGTKNQAKLGEYLNKLSTFTSKDSLVAWKTKNFPEIKEVLSGQGELYEFTQRYEETLDGMTPKNFLAKYLNLVKICNSLEELNALWADHNTTMNKDLGPEEFKSFGSAWHLRKAEVMQAPPEDPGDQTEPETPADDEDPSLAKERKKLQMAIEFAGEDVYRNALGHCKLNPASTPDFLTSLQCVAVSEKINQLMDEA